jgi:hypothetical protein
VRSRELLVYPGEFAYPALLGPVGTVSVVSHQGYQYLLLGRPRDSRYLPDIFITLKDPGTSAGGLKKLYPRPYSTYLS